MGRREYLMVLLTDKTRQLGRVVTSEEMRSDPKMPSPNDYTFYSGSFMLAAEDAWAQVCREKKKGDGVRAKIKRPAWKYTLKEMMEFAPKKVEKKASVEELVGSEVKSEVSVKMSVESEAKRQRWTKAMCLDFLRKERERLERLPMQKEVNAKSAAGEGPSYVTLVKYLGKKKGWLKLLGISANGSGVEDAKDTKDTKEE